MEDKQLAPFEKTSIIIREIDETQLNTSLTTKLFPYVKILLQLNEEQGLNFVLLVIPLIKKECKGMSLYEIQKMFELYTTRGLDIDPMQNNMNVMVFSSIRDAYRRYLRNTIQAKEIKQTYVSDDEKQYWIRLGVENFFKDIDAGFGVEQQHNRHWVYDYLYKELKLEEDKLFKFSDDEKRLAMSEAVIRVRKSTQQQRRFGKVVKNSLQESLEKQLAKKILLYKLHERLKRKDLNILNFIP